MVGDGHIDFAGFARAVAAAGYTVFNADVRTAPGDEVVVTSSRRYVELVAPHL